MLALIVLIKQILLDTYIGNLGIRRRLFGGESHFAYFLQYKRILDRLKRILSPYKRTMAVHKNGMYLGRINAPFIELLNNHSAGVELVIVCDLIFFQASGTGNGSVCKLLMRCAVRRNITARLCPGTGIS